MLTGQFEVLDKDTYPHHLACNLATFHHPGLSGRSIPTPICVDGVSTIAVAIIVHPD